MQRLPLAMTVTVAIGLASRLHPTGWFLWDRVLGEVLYAVAAYIVWAVLLVRKPPLLIAGIAFASCLAVEVFKLTGIPADNQDVFLVRWFLGMTFSAVNLGYYLIGVVLSAFADRATRGLPRRSGRGDRGTEPAAVADSGPAGYSHPDPARGNGDA